MRLVAGSVSSASKYPPLTFGLFTRSFGAVRRPDVSLAVWAFELGLAHDPTKAARTRFLLYRFLRRGLEVITP